MEITRFCDPFMGENCYLVRDLCGAAAVIDPGFEAAEKVLPYAEEIRALRSYCVGQGNCGADACEDLSARSGWRISAGKPSESVLFDAGPALPGIFSRCSVPGRGADLCGCIVIFCAAYAGAHAGQQLLFDR